MIDLREYANAHQHLHEVAFPLFLHWRALLHNATQFNQPLDLWSVANVTSMSNMFTGATSFNQSIDMWDTSNVVTDLNDLFCQS